MRADIYSIADPLHSRSVRLQQRLVQLRLTLRLYEKDGFIYCSFSTLTGKWRIWLIFFIISFSISFSSSLVRKLIRARDDIEFALQLHSSNPRCENGRQWQGQIIETLFSPQFMPWFWAKEKKMWVKILDARIYSIKYMRKTSNRLTRKRCFATNFDLKANRDENERRRLSMFTDVFWRFSRR